MMSTKNKTMSGSVSSKEEIDWDYEIDNVLGRRFADWPQELTDELVVVVNKAVKVGVEEGRKEGIYEAFLASKPFKERVKRAEKRMALKDGGK